MLITLLTDFGTKDHFVGAMKGVILSINPDARIIDITHEIPPQDIRSAGFTLSACYREFPGGTIFVAVVDPGVGSDRRAILVQTREHYFIAPDNGLLSFVFNEPLEDFGVFEISDERFFRHPVSRTFHGRDIFSPAAAHLSNGIAPAGFGPPKEDFICFEEAKPHKTFENGLIGEIIHTDRFGNLITNLKKADLPSSGFILEIAGRRIIKRLEYFAGAAPGEIFMIFGSTGFLEIAAFRDSAQQILVCGIGEKLKILEK